MAGLVEMAVDGGLEVDSFRPARLTFKADWRARGKHPFQAGVHYLRYNDRNSGFGKTRLW